jgi:hypothetical protein
MRALDRHLTIISGHDGIALTLQAFLEQSDHIGIIIDD